MDKEEEGNGAQSGSDDNSGGNDKNDSDEKNGDNDKNEGNDKNDDTRSSETNENDKSRDDEEEAGRQRFAELYAYYLPQIEKVKRKCSELGDNTPPVVQDCIQKLNAIKKNVEQPKKKLRMSQMDWYEKILSNLFSKAKFPNIGNMDLNATSTEGETFSQSDSVNISSEAHSDSVNKSSEAHSDSVNKSSEAHSDPAKTSLEASKNSSSQPESKARELSPQPSTSGMCSYKQKVFQKNKGNSLTHPKSESFSNQKLCKNIKGNGNHLAFKSKRSYYNNCIPFYKKEFCRRTANKYNCGRRSSEDEISLGVDPRRNNEYHTQKRSSGDHIYRPFDYNSTRTSSQEDFIHVTEDEDFYNVCAKTVKNFFKNKRPKEDDLDHALKKKVNALILPQVENSEHEEWTRRVYRNKDVKTATEQESHKPNGKDKARRSSHENPKRDNKPKPRVGSDQKIPSTDAVIQKKTNQILAEKVYKISSSVDETKKKRENKSMSFEKTLNKKPSEKKADKKSKSLEENHKTAKISDKTAYGVHDDPDPRKKNISISKSPIRSPHQSPATLLRPVSTNSLWNPERPESPPRNSAPPGLKNYNQCKSDRNSDLFGFTSRGRRNSVSSDFDEFEKDLNDEIDNDMIKLKNSKRNLEALMHNRLASLNANKRKNDTTSFANEPSNTLSDITKGVIDDVMLNLTAKFKYNRHPQEQKQTNEKDTHDSIKNLTECTQTEEESQIKPDNSEVHISFYNSVQTEDQTSDQGQSMNSPPKDIVISTDKEKEENPTHTLNLITPPSVCSRVNNKIGPFNAEEYQFDKINLTNHNLSKDALKEIIANSKALNESLGTDLTSNVSMMGSKEKKNSVQETNISNPAINHTSFKIGEETDKINQSVRSKLSDEISTLHKVGASGGYGGSFKSLIHKEKMMPPGRLASLKTGTIIDLIQEDNLQRSVQKPKKSLQTPLTVNIDSSFTPSVPRDSNHSIPTHDTNYILSTLSENDLKDLISKNIGQLPSPPILPFTSNNASSLNSYGSDFHQAPPSQSFAWSYNSNSVQQIQLNAQNVESTNLCSSSEYNNSFDNSVLIQNSHSTLWRNSNETNEIRINSLSDPRMVQNGNPNTLSNLHQPYDNSIYKANCNNVDPWCRLDETGLGVKPYDASKILGPFQSRFHYGQSFHEEPDKLNSYASVSNTGSHAANSLSSSLILSNRPRPTTSNSNLSTSSLNATTTTSLNFNITNVSSQLTSTNSHLTNPPSQQYYRNVTRNMSPNRRDTSSYFSGRRVKRTFADTVYESWKIKYDDVRMSRIKNDQNYHRWMPNDYNQHNHRNNISQQNKYHQGNQSLGGYHRQPIIKKLSSRDPRLKSLEENNKKGSDCKVNSCSEDTLSFRKDPRTREKTPSKDEERLQRVKGPHYMSKREQLSRKETYRFSRRHTNESVKHNQGEKRTNVNDAYVNSCPLKMGSVDGLNKFKIPKIKKTNSDYNTNNNCSEVVDEEPIKNIKRKDDKYIEKESSDLTCITKPKDSEVHKLTQPDQEVTTRSNIWKTDDCTQENSNSSPRKSSRLANLAKKQSTDHLKGFEPLPCPNIDESRKICTPFISQDNQSDNKNVDIMQRNNYKNEPNTLSGTETNFVNSSETTFNDIDSSVTKAIQSDTSKERTSNTQDKEKKSDITSEDSINTSSSAGSNNIVDNIENSLQIDSTQTKPEKSICYNGNEAPHTTEQEIVNPVLTPELVLLQQKYGEKIPEDLLKLFAEIISKGKNEDNQCPQISSTDKILAVNDTAESNIDNEIMCTSDLQDNKTSQETIVCESTNYPNSVSKKKIYKRKRISKVKSKKYTNNYKATNKNTNGQKRKYKNELDKLQDDISKYHDSDAIAAATGLRLCRIQKEKSQTLAPESNINALPNNRKKNIDKQPKVVTEENTQDSDDMTKSDKSNDQVKKELESNIHCDSDSSDSNDPLEQLTKRLKSKYEPLILESQAKTRKEQLLKEEENKSLEYSKITDVPKQEQPATLQEPKKSSSTLNSDECQLNENDKETKKSDCQKLDTNQGSNKSRSTTMSPTINHHQTECLDAKSSIEEAICTIDSSDSLCKNKMYKSKQANDSTESNKDTVNSSCLDESEELIVPEPPDKNYYQDVKIKDIECKLCSYRGAGIVSHYTINHPKDEVLISRMSPKAANEALMESNLFFINTDEIKEVLPYKCRVCLLNYKTFTRFFEHVALHTGEFRHECCSCGYRTSTMSGISKHCRQKHGIKNSTEVRHRILYKEPKNHTFCSAYLCVLCNFFQINYINVKRHIENYHTHDDNSDYIKKINMAKIPSKYLKTSDKSEQHMEKTNALESSITIEEKCTESEINVNRSPSPINNAKNTSTEKVTPSKSIVEHDQNCLTSDNIVNSSSPDVSMEIRTENCDSTLINHTDCLAVNQSSEESVESSIAKETSSQEVETIENRTLLVVDITNIETPISNNTMKGHSDLPESIVDLTPPEGCFELPPSLNNFVQSNEVEKIKLYKDLCDQAIATISYKKNDCSFVESLLEKQSSEATCSKEVYNLEDLIKNRRKFKKSENVLVSETNIDSKDSTEGVTPSRRLLPERTCKSFSKIRNLNEDDSFEDLFQDLDEPEIEMNSDTLVEVKQSNSASSEPYESNAFEKSSLVQRCKQLITNKQPLKPKMLYYKSSLPTSTNLSEFTYVMTQMQNLTLKSEIEQKIIVGDLRVYHTGNNTIFTCCVKEDEEGCEFQTMDLEKFGQHINLCHCDYHWDGSCTTCFAVFIQDPSSHDKADICTQNRAFCHLVRHHLKFDKKVEQGKPNEQHSMAKDNSETTVALEPARTFLRVRRLSGDKLSTPGRSNNITSESQSSDAITATTESPDKNRKSNNIEIDDGGLGFSSQVMETLKYSSFIEYNIMKTAAAYKLSGCYKAMCIPNKLRHFYKCMAVQCNFSTSCAKSFAAHFNLHSLSSANEWTWQNQFWDVCSYCFTTHNTGRELGIHLTKAHGHCTLQCAHCFYRAHSIANVDHHHKIEHKGEELCVLQCKQNEPSLSSNDERPFTEIVISLRCIQAGCLFVTYVLKSFFQHLSNVHKCYQCHLCHTSKGTEIGLLKHYKESHGIALYQCMYCTYGAFTEESIKTHLCYKHPNSLPKAVMRATCVRLEETVPHKNKEILKRLIFNKDQEELMKYLVDFPKEEYPRLMENKSQLTPPRPVLFRGISSPAIVAHEYFYECNDSSSSELLSITSKKPVRPIIDPFSSQPIGMTNIIRILPTVTQGNSSVRTSSPSPQNYPPVTSVTHAVPSLLIQPLTDVPVSSKSTKTTNSSHSTSSSSVEPSLLASQGCTVQFQLDSVATSTGSETNLNMAESCDNENQQEIKNEEPTNLTLFRCGHNGCAFGAHDADQLKIHMLECDRGEKTEKLKCVFCERQFKLINSLINHLNRHGPARFKCSNCDMKSPLKSHVIKHMKIVHNIYSTVIVPADNLKGDLGTDCFIVIPKIRTGLQISKPNLKFPKTKYSPEDIEEVPMPAIFANQLGCALCPFESKVRSNFLRHLRQHAEGDCVNKEEFINPVPNKKEKMFDKMMNLAGSSHKKKDSADSEAAEACPYKYVADQLRYMCHVSGCGYRSLSETMLREHITIIHKEETLYVCPHCATSHEPIPIAQLGLHLKLHDSPLFKCSFPDCDFYCHNRRSIEKHQSSSHYGVDVAIKIVRTGRPDVPAAPALVDLVGEPGEEEWYTCSLCTFQTKKKKAILSHGCTDHNITKPFCCSICKYESATDTIFRSHFKNCHPKEGDSCKVITFYRKVNQAKPPASVPVAPLWRRDPNKIKLIRGIGIDEKGDAPPPVATGVIVDITSIDRVQLKYGPHGTPIDGCYTCPRCPNFQTNSASDFRDHLYKHFEYKPFSCTICNIVVSHKIKIIKHVNKAHNIDVIGIDDFIIYKVNEDFETWVDKTINNQGELIKETLPVMEDDKEVSKEVAENNTEKVEVISVNNSPVSLRKRRRSSVIAGEETPSQQIAVFPDSDVSNQRKKKKRPLNRYKCFDCGMMAKYKTIMTVHYKKRHPSKKLQIVPVNRSAADISEAFMCGYCKCIALNKFNVRCHHENCHQAHNLRYLVRKVGLQTDRIFHCYYCEMSSTLETLAEHSNRAHSVSPFVFSLKKPYFDCFEIESAESPLDEDHQSATAYDQVPTAPKLNQTYKCPLCPYGNKQFCTLVEHIENHFMTYVCRLCDAVVSSEYNFRRHMRIKHCDSSCLSKPVIIGCPPEDLINAKKGIILVSTTGKRRMITVKELELAERESKVKCNIDVRTSNTPKDHLPATETNPIIVEIENALQSGCENSDVVLSFKSHGRYIKLPLDVCEKMFKLDLLLSPNSSI